MGPRAAAIVVAAVAFLLVFTVGVLLTRLTERDAATLPPQDEPDPAAIAAFVELGNIDTVAERAVRLFWENESWIYRRVERIGFVDGTLVRRRISVDFEIPPNAFEVATEEGQPAKRYLPISVLRSWPPVLNFDLRDHNDRPLPLLSRSTTNRLDEEVLRLVGRHAMGDAADEVVEQVKRIVHQEGKRARDAFVVLQEGVLDHFEHESVPDLELYLRFRGPRRRADRQHDAVDPRRRRGW